MFAGPVLPAAITNRVSCLSRQSCGEDIGSLQSVGSCCPGSWRRRRPSVDRPLHARDDPGGRRRRCHRGPCRSAGCVRGDALLLPPLAAPEPPTVDAVWVPWPERRSAPPVTVKFWEAAIRPFRSGCSASAPVSRTATLVPVRRAGGPGLVGVHLLVDWSRLAWTLRRARSSRSRRPSGAGSVSVGEEVAACSLSAFSAMPSMSGGRLPASAPRGCSAPGAVRRCRRDDGTVSVFASSYPWRPAR